MNPEQVEELQLSHILAINIVAELSKMEQKEFAYLQMVAPSWMLNNDPLFSQLTHLHKLYTEGRIVWGAVVQANELLFSQDETDAYSCPADIVYDPTGNTSVNELTQVATKLYALKHTHPDDPELQQYAEHVTDEWQRNCQPVPKKISNLPLLTTVIFLWRLHLPDGALSSKILPILVHDDYKGIVTVVPARFWENTYFYQHWLQQSNRMIEMSSAFYQLNKNGTFWQDFTPNTKPELGQIPEFATQPQPYAAKFVSQDSLSFIFAYQKLLKFDYQKTLKTSVREKPTTGKIIWRVIVVGILLHLIWQLFFK